MSSFLLRVEGVNLSGFIEDTQDLSTIRGGGLLLLNAPEVVGEFLERSGYGTTRIAEGASIGLFRVETERQGEDVRADVAQLLAEKVPEATFGVDVNATENSSPADIALLEARNRWRQMQSPTAVYPELKGVTTRTEVCKIDMVRPACEGAEFSASVENRKKYGKKQKQQFYSREMRRVGEISTGLAALEYANEFDGICGDSGEWGNLRDKMAVIHLDGNGFGSHARTLDAKELRKFSNEVRETHARILRALIEERILPDPDWQVLDYELKKMVIRLETLLWGGDEIIWVVPAWKGWEVLQFFFDHVGDPLRTYSAGLVFCHKKTPIHTVTHLAHQLTRVVKETDRNKNVFLYQVLESFDHIVEPDKETYGKWVLPAEKMLTIEAAMPEWREWVSRKKLHRGLKVEIRKELSAVRTPGSEKALRGMDALSDEALYHMAELWDYVSPEREGSES